MNKLIKRNTFKTAFGALAAALLLAGGSLQAGTTTTTIATGTTSTTTIASDFNTSSDQDYFNYTFSGASATYSSSAGVNSTGGFSVPYSVGSHSLWTSKTALNNAQGNALTISGAFYNTNSNYEVPEGYGLIGFSSLSSNALSPDYPAAISSGIEFAFYDEGGYFIKNGSIVGYYNWNTANGEHVLAVNTWFNVSLSLTLDASSDYTFLLTISKLSGDVIYSTSYTFDDAALAAAASIYGFAGTSNARITALDNVSVAETVPEPSTYASLMAGGVALLGLMRRGRGEKRNQ